ncbi:MAG: FmdB family transcriptional regulator [Actinobacteria bacterium]|nr:FmdB family transcriptional regulator [Actinomycetota bacterium]
MPTYDYRCRACGHEFEIHQSFKDDPLTECPECAGELRKVFSNVSISFKGSGFYKNDARGSSSGSTSASSASGSSSDSGSSSGSSSSSSSSASSSASAD